MKAVYATLAVLAIAYFVQAADVPFLWGRPFRLVGTPQETQIVAGPGNTYSFKPITLKAGDNLVVTYNKTPHILVLGKAPGDASLGTVAPEGPGGAVFTIPFKTPGTFIVSDTFLDENKVPYWKSTNAYLQVTVTPAAGARRLL